MDAEHACAVCNHYHNISCFTETRYYSNRIRKEDCRELTKYNKDLTEAKNCEEKAEELTNSQDRTYHIYLSLNY